MSLPDWFVDGSRAIFNEAEADETENLWEGRLEMRTSKKNDTTWWFVVSKVRWRERGCVGTSKPLSLSLLSPPRARPQEDARLKGAKEPAFDMKIDTENLSDFDIREWKESLKRPARVSPHPPSPPSDEGGRGKRRRKQVVRVDYTAEAFGSDDEMEDFDDDDESDEDVFNQKDVEEESSSSEASFDTDSSDDDAEVFVDDDDDDDDDVLVEKPKTSKAKAKTKTKAGADDDTDTNPLVAIEGTGKMSESWKVRI
jgi:hypothetical protein